jgi:hypothetical protein
MKNADDALVYDIGQTTVSALEQLLRVTTKNSSDGFGEDTCFRAYTLNQKVYMLRDKEQYLLMLMSFGAPH